VSLLSRDELAAEAEAEAGLVDDLVRIGALKPDAAGMFATGDILRVQTVLAGLRAGISLEAFGRALAERLQTLDYIDRFYLEPSPRSARTYAEFAATLGAQAADLPAVWSAFGLAEPDATSRLRTDDERIIEDFLATWGRFGDRDMLVRAARLNGEGVRRVVEGIVRLYFEKVSGPLTDRGLPLEELVRLTVEPATAVADLQPRLMVWLEQRHIEHVINELNFDELERTLADRGWAPPRSSEPPAIAFVDLSGFTTATERHGDERAAGLIAILEDLARAVTRRHGGRVVKLLGDGVMMRFERAIDAALASVELVARAPSEGLPMAHAGVHAGPIIERDGDVYGHTVNLAARIADRASAGEVLVSGEARTLVEGSGMAFEPLGATELKGLAAPVSLWRVRGLRARQ
jgi:adenylate cyclase